MAKLEKEDIILAVVLVLTLVIGILNKDKAGDVLKSIKDLIEDKA